MRYLLRTPLHSKVERHFWPNPGSYASSGIVAALGALSCFYARLFSSVAAVATPADNFAANRAADPAQNLGNLRERLIRFHKSVDLVSFFLAEVLVHRSISTWRLKRL